MRAEYDGIHFTCIGCGARNPVGAAACSGCGHRFAGPDPGPGPGIGPLPDPFEVEYWAHRRSEPGEEEVALGCLGRTVAFAMVALASIAASLIAFFATIAALPDHDLISLLALLTALWAAGVVAVALIGLGPHILPGNFVTAVDRADRARRADDSTMSASEAVDLSPLSPRERGRG